MAYFFLKTLVADISRSNVRSSHMCRTLATFKPSMKNSLNGNIAHQRRFLSSTSSLVDIERDPSFPEIALFTMTNKPVNAINIDFISAMKQGLRQIEADQSYRGVVLSSEYPKAFCAGFDLTSVHAKSCDEIKVLMSNFQELCGALFSSRLLTIAAIDGVAAGVGCALAMACEYRIISEGKHQIGLNEVALNFPVTRWMCSFMSYIIGPLATERAVLTGTMFKPDSALRIGLVDNVVPTAELVPTCVNFASQVLKVPDFSRRTTKETLRRQLLDEYMQDSDVQALGFAEGCSRDDVQNAIGGVLERLKKKKS